MSCCAAIQRKEVERRQPQIANPGSIKPHTHFIRPGVRLTQAEGGRSQAFHRLPPPVYFRTTDVTGVASAGSVEMCMPGDHVRHRSS